MLDTEGEVLESTDPRGRLAAIATGGRRATVADLLVDGGPSGAPARFDDDGGLPPRIAAQLANAIVEGVLAPGTRLNEQEIAEALGASRTPVRDALRLLERDMLVTLRPRRGAVVAEIDAETAHQVYACRMVLHGLAARLATETASGQELAELAELVDRMASTADEDPQAYYRLGVAFHRMLGEATHNQVLLRHLEQLSGVSLRLHFLTLRLPGRIEASVADHRRLVEAMRRRDAAGAEQVRRSMILASGVALLKGYFDAPDHAARLQAQFAGDR
ncbi:MAG: GntR family transcriptional regulator [Pseudonocardia sp.]